MTKACRYKSQSVKSDIRTTWMPNKNQALKLPKALRIAKLNAIKYATAPNPARGIPPIVA